MPNTNHAAPILKLLGWAAQWPPREDSNAHQMVTRTDAPCLPVAACGARGPFSKIQQTHLRVLIMRGDRWLLTACRRCDYVVGAHYDRLRHEAQRREETIR